jgi:hypothetical protein
MLAKLWQRLRERHERQERLEDEAAVEQALDEHDAFSEADKLPPIFKNQDWTMGGPTGN